MITNILDKLIFGTLLVLIFQIPVISDHYLQFISGYYEATKVQVDGYKANAARHEYSDVYAMVDELLANPNPVIKMDAEQKLNTLQEFDELRKAVSVLKNGSIFTRGWFIFQPSRQEALGKVMENYKPSIPLNISDIVLSVIVALVLSALLMWPLRFLQSFGRRRN